MEIDHFPSVAEHCTISPSQEELLRRIGFARKHQSDDESQDQPLGTAVESVGIIMVSPPDSAEDEERQDVYHTPPEEAAVQSSDCGDTVATNYECMDSERAVDLGRDMDLGFWMEWTATERVSGGDSESKFRASGSNSQKAGVSKRVMESGQNSKQSLSKKRTGDKGLALESISGRIMVSKEKIDENLKLVGRNEDFDKSKDKSLKLLGDKSEGDLVIHSVDEGLTESPGGRSKILDVHVGMETPHCAIEIAKEKIVKSLEKCVEDLKNYGSDDQHKAKFHHSGSVAKKKLDLSVELILHAANIIDAEVEKSDTVLEAVEGVERDGLVNNLSGGTTENEGMNREVKGDDRVNRNNRREQITGSIDEIEKFKFTGKTHQSKGKELVEDVRNETMNKHLPNREAYNGHGGQVQILRKRTWGLGNTGSTLGESSKVGRGVRRLPASIQRSAMDVEGGLDSCILPEPSQHSAMDAEKGIDSGNLPPLASREVSLLDVLKWIAGPLEEDKIIGKMNILDVARQCGIVFPQPRWWPQEGF